MIACELHPDEASRQRAGWRGIRHQVEIVERTRVPGGFGISFRGPQSAVEAVESLVALERKCCGWADWQVQTRGDRVVLQVTGPEVLIEPLARAFGVAGAP